ncbi:MAG: right-handed parallel beta-helix repeat-containing protein [Planctomycetota bacterium]
MLKKITILVILLLNCCDLIAATYWISPDGKPSGTGSESDPFASAEAALSKAGGGNTFIFKPGNYIGTQITLSAAHAGSSQQPTVLKSQHKYEAVLHGSPFHNIYVKNGCKWVIIDGFESSGALYTGIKSDADYTVIRNCRIHNNALQGIEAHNVRGTVIENNIIEYNGAHLQFSHGVYADGDDLTIRNNIVRFNSGWGLHLYPQIANSQIENNLIYANARWGIALYSRPRIGSNRIVNNTIVLNGSGITVKNAQNEIIANNIVVDNTGWKFEKTEPIHNLDGGRLSSEKAMIDYNLCLPVFAGAGPHGISADPLFLDSQKGTFYLRKGSPAVAKGSGKYAPKRDFFNRLLPEGGTADLGCFPYDPSLLLPEAREDWYYQWPFLCRGKTKTMPDLWKLPQPGRPGKNDPAMK